MSDWSGGKVRKARRFVETMLPMPCWRCGRMITSDMNWQVGHLIDRADAPDLATDPENMVPEHARCNMAAGGRKGRARQLARTVPPTSRRW